jgi:hypothetical protein
MNIQETTVLQIVLDILSAKAKCPHCDSKTPGKIKLCEDDGIEGIYTSVTCTKCEGIWNIGNIMEDIMWKNKWWKEGRKK